jgi:hypothetical protein
LFPSIHYQSTGAPSTNRQISSTVLTSFLLSLSQTALIITTTVTRNVTAPLAKTIVTATVIVGIGTGTVAGETETSVNAILTVIGNAQTAVTAIGIATGTVNAVVIMKDARATRKNADGSSRAKKTDVGHTAARRKGAPLVVPAAAAAASVTAAHQNVAHPHLWARLRCRNGSARPVVGTSMHRAMSSTLPCRRNKPVRIALYVFIRCC